MKKALVSGLLAGTMLLGSMGLSGCGQKKDYTTPAAEATQAALVGAQTPSPASVLDSVAPLSETGATQTVKTGTGIEYLSPLVTLRADPYLYKSPTTGKYYFTGSYPTYDRIDLRSADTVNGIASAEPKEIWRRDDPTITNVWAPELHYVMGQWVMYYAACEPNGNPYRSLKCRALRCKGNDPMNDEWENMGVIETVKGDNVSFMDMSLDMTPFEANGKWYCIWAQCHDGTGDWDSKLFLAEMETPFKLKTKPIRLSRPEYDWERDRLAVNEGPAVLKNAGKIFVSFSASATGEEYRMGLLEINEDADMLDINNWKKWDHPVFETDEEHKIYGPGHNSFVKGDNDEWLCVVHFRNYDNDKIIGGVDNSLFDHNRHAHVMKLKFDEDGAPVFKFNFDGDVFNRPFENEGL